MNEELSSIFSQEVKYTMKLRNNNLLLLLFLFILKRKVLKSVNFISFIVQIMILRLFFVEKYGKFHLMKRKINFYC